MNKPLSRSGILLVVIYLAYISLGLPDPLLGAGWAKIRETFDLPLALAGMISMTITGTTILSSWLSHKWIDTFGTGKVTLVSVGLTTVALAGFAYSPSIYWFFLFAIPLGLGAGCVDAGLNNYVALHYKPHHMNWLHSFWGIGATVGPMIMGQVILRTDSWRAGYGLIAGVQTVLFVFMLVSLPLWDKTHTPLADDTPSKTDAPPQHPSESNLFKVPGVAASLLSFLLYCGIELTIGLWGASYLIQSRHLSIPDAAGAVAIYYGGITLGRMVSGFLTLRFSCKRLIYTGEAMVAAGIVLMWLPLPLPLTLLSFLLVGLGCAPIFPCMIHETPQRFGKERSQEIISKQVAFAYIGNTALPMFFGLLLPFVSIQILPGVLFVYAVGMILANGWVEKVTASISHSRSFPKKR